jgi:hypothetical protein
MVEDEIDAPARRAAGIKIANVTFDHPESGRALLAHERFVEICAMPGAEVVETDHRLAERKQILE